MTDGQKLVAFLDGVMATDNHCVPIDHTVPKEATQEEMEQHCKLYACKDCPIIKNCSMAASLFVPMTACPKCGTQVLDPFGSGKIIHNVDECCGR